MQPDTRRLDSPMVGRERELEAVGLAFERTVERAWSADS